MVIARGDNTATLLPDGRVLVVGGADASTAELYHPSTRTWTATRRLIEPRTAHAAALLADGRVLVVGGTDELGRFVAMAELYDPETGRWTAAGKMKQPRGNHTATRLADGKVLVAGGSRDLDGASALASADLYDPATGSWTATGKMATGRAGHTATLLRDGRLLVVGGVGPFVNPIEPRSLATAELYDPGSGRWTDAHGMSEARFDHTLTLLPDGRVLIAGGSEGFGAVSDSVELYDPVKRVWTAAATMTESHSEHTATLLADGMVLVAGGYEADGTASTFTESYDPTTGSWSAGKPMIEARIRHSATLLLDGAVLVVGNTYGDEADTPELYDPGT
jgi:N-acetylneuraminic acid mutarotase